MITKEQAQKLVGKRVAYAPIIGRLEHVEEGVLGRLDTEGTSAFVYYDTDVHPKSTSLDHLSPAQPLPRCVGCKKNPYEIPEYSRAFTESSLNPVQFVRAEEGTFNPENGHFACTDCYIAMGMPAGTPSNPNGRWVAP